MLSQSSATSVVLPAYPKQEPKDNSLPSTWLKYLNEYQAWLDTQKLTDIKKEILQFVLSFAKKRFTKVGLKLWTSNNRKLVCRVILSRDNVERSEADFIIYVQFALGMIKETDSQLKNTILYTLLPTYYHRQADPYFQDQYPEPSSSNCTLEEFQQFDRQFLSDEIQNFMNQKKELQSILRKKAPLYMLMTLMLEMMVTRGYCFSYPTLALFAIIVPIFRYFDYENVFDMNGLLRKTKAFQVLYERYQFLTRKGPASLKHTDVLKVLSVIAKYLRVNELLAWEDDPNPQSISDLPFEFTSLIASYPQFSCYLPSMKVVPRRSISEQHPTTLASSSVPITLSLGLHQHHLFANTESKKTDSLRHQEFQQVSITSTSSSGKLYQNQLTSFANALPKGYYEEEENDDSDDHDENSASLLTSLSFD